MTAATIDALRAAGGLTPLDHQFGQLLRDRLGAADEVALAGALASRYVGRHASCLPLDQVAGQLLPRAEGESLTTPLRAPALRGWRASLESSALVQCWSGKGDLDPARPLVLDRGQRVYLLRYFRYELELARALRAMAAAEVPFVAGGDRDLEELFPGSSWDEQRQAARLALGRRLAVITGGPGTGKTTTVLRLLLALLRREPGQRLLLAAPTGKAAQRLGESIGGQIETQGGWPDWARALLPRVPRQAQTLHRLLETGWAHGGARGLDRPLAADALVVDEASMVDLPMFARLLAALPAPGRLILLGDADQLASVELGSVLGDVCAAARTRGGELGEVVRILTRSHRFAQTAPLGRALAAVRAGDAAAAVEILEAGSAEATRVDTGPDPRDFVRHLVHRAARGFGPYIEALAALRALGPGDEARFEPALAAAFRVWRSFVILCALRGGPRGVRAVNALVERRLSQGSALDVQDPWYFGRPVMVTRNDYGLEVFNGDVGLVLDGPGAGGAWTRQVFFPAPGGGHRGLRAALLGDCETVFALTIHKSQGSEYDEVAVILPQADSRILSRELVYTGLSRARRRAEVWASEEVLRTALARRSGRPSGLESRLGEATEKGDARG